MKIKWNPLELYNQATEYLESLDPNKTYTCYIEEKETKALRTLTQNNMFHWLFWEIAKHLWEHMEDVKQNFMKWLFWVKKTKLWKLEFENAIKPHTSDLTKEESIFLIDNILKFIEKYKVPCKYSSAELKSLYDSYK